MKTKHYTPIYKENDQQRYVTLPGGLVDLFTDPLALSAGLNVQWVITMLSAPLDVRATVDEWRAYFIRLLVLVDRKAA